MNAEAHWQARAQRVSNTKSHLRSSRMTFHKEEAAERGTLSGPLEAGRARQLQQSRGSALRGLNCSQDRWFHLCCHISRSFLHDLLPELSSWPIGRGKRLRTILDGARLGATSSYVRERTIPKVISAGNRKKFPSLPFQAAVQRCFRSELGEDDEDDS